MADQPKTEHPAASKVLNYATPVRTRPGLDFSMTGLVYSAMMLFMGLAAVNSQANLLFGVFGLMIGILLVSAVISRTMLRRIAVRRVLPHHGVVGRPMSVTYELTNRKRLWPSLSVCVAELDGAAGFIKQPQSYLLHVAPRMTAEVPAEFMPKRRGVHEMHRYQLSTSFPFGFVKRAITLRQKDHVLIHPAIGEVDPRLMAMCRSAEKTGASVRPRPGGTDEFYGLHEYREGDNPRLISWRRSARTGTLVTRLMTQVSPPRILLVVDTFARDRSVAEHARIERAIAMAASVAVRALDEGMSVGLYAWSGDWTGVHPDRGKRHRDDLLSILARLPLNTEHDTHALLERVSRFTKSGTTAMLFTPRDMQPTLGGVARGSTVVVSADGSSGQGWFRFDAAVDFTTCMPPDQQPPPAEQAAGAANQTSPPGTR